MAVGIWLFPQKLVWFYIHARYEFRVFFWCDAPAAIFVRSRLVFLSVSYCLPTYRGFQNNSGFFFQQTDCPSGMTFRNRTTGQFNQSCFSTPINLAPCIVWIYISFKFSNGTNSAASFIVKMNEIARIFCLNINRSVR